MRRLGRLGLLDRYIARIFVGSFAACLLFTVGSFVLIELFMDFDRYADNIEQLPVRYRQIGVLLIGAYYAVSLPFLYVMLAPYVTVTAGMFAVGRLMGSNEVIPMLFTGRRLLRVLLPVFLMAAANAMAMIGLRELVLPQLATARENLGGMLTSGQLDHAVEDRVVRLAGGDRLYFERYFKRAAVFEGLELRTRVGNEIGHSIRATRAEWSPDGVDGPGWALTAGRRVRPGAQHGDVVTFLPLWQAHFDPEALAKRLKESDQLMDLTLADLLGMQREQPSVPDYVLAAHRAVTFPLANVLLLLLALPLALRFEPGGRVERIVFALLVCGTYLVADLITQSAGSQGILQPVLAAWLPTVLFGSLGIAMFDTVRT
ncbi:MAG: hypothetical protein CMJ85_09330 [Planctomycetes bacterium]|nr:hypothetical protein [Planctomycetota bacterium]